MSVLRPTIPISISIPSKTTVLWKHPLCQLIIFYWLIWLFKWTSIRIYLKLLSQVDGHLLVPSKRMSPSNPDTSELRTYNLFTKGPPEPHFPTWSITTVVQSPSLTTILYHTRNVRWTLPTRVPQCSIFFYVTFLSGLVILYSIVFGK